MDYYTVGEDGLLIEEFAWREDWTAAGLHSSSAAFSRELRADPVARERVKAVGRGEAEAVFRRLGGAPLPAEAELRAGFQEYQPFPEAAPLRLSSSEPPRGFRERRVYRVLFAGERDVRMEGERQVDGDEFSWLMRTVGGGVARGLDVTIHLRHQDNGNIGTLLGELTGQARMSGLIPVTVERFA